MQGYGKQLSLKEIAAVVTYERNAWGNDTGDTVQAADVNAVSSSDAPVPAVVSEAKAAVTEAVDDLATKIADAAPTEDLTKSYAKDELMTMGEQVYNTSCASCHQATGLGVPPAFPALKGSAIATGDINKHIDMVVNGSKKNPAMMAFSSLLTKTQIAAVVTFERNAWGNDTGDLVQPADVDAASAK